MTTSLFCLIAFFPELWKMDLEISLPVLDMGFVIIELVDRMSERLHNGVSCTAN